MARAYGDDLRRKLLEAFGADKGSLAELARVFGVSASWAKRVYATFLRSGRMERPPGGKRGRRSRVTAEALQYLASQVKEQPDRTLAKLQEDLEGEHEIRIGITQLWNILKGLGLRFKKSRSTPLNRIANESRRKDSSGRKKPNRSIRRGSSSSTKAP